MTHSIAIIGGGAGGIFAALAASHAAREHEMATEVHLFERNPRLGIKILISGGGKCNITHEGPVEEILIEGFPRKIEQRFLKSAMYRYSNEEVIAMLERNNVNVHARENGRVFPDSGRAEDVLNALESELREQNIIVHTNSRIVSVSISESGQWNLVWNSEHISANALVLATGGTSYSKTGTTGDGIGYALELGHTIVPVRASLAPIYLKQAPSQSLVGISLRDIEISITRNSKTLASRHGDVLITHRGLSGPAVLGISNAAAMLMEDGPISVEANIIGKNEDGARAMLIAEQQSNSNQQVKTFLESLLPNRFVPFVMDDAEVPTDRKWHELTRDERVKLASTLIHYSFGEVSDVPMERGEVTSGGVSLGEVDAKTMMSRIHPGLFFAGEMLDVAGEIGGYNLQAAYSTGWVAGESAVIFLSEHKKRER
jgi:predicted Rossmann fold flavoprotein